MLLGYLGIVVGIFGNLNFERNSEKVCEHFWQRTPSISQRAVFNSWVENSKEWTVGALIPIDLEEVGNIGHSKSGFNCLKAEINFFAKR